MFLHVGHHFELLRCYGSAPRLQHCTEAACGCHGYGKQTAETARDDDDYNNNNNNNNNLALHNFDERGHATL
jgi:hypothetical protein